jgi:MFS family permease
VVANFLVGVVLMTVMVNIPIVVALGTERSQAGLASAVLLAPFTMAIATASLATGSLARKFAEGRMLAVGVTLSILGPFLIAPPARDDNQAGMVPGLLVVGIGIGLLLPPLGAIPIQIARDSERGSAAASALMFRLLGMTIGVSLLTAAGVSRLQALTGRLDPVVQESGESTASFLVRQQQFIIDHAIPLSRQVVSETFLAVGAIAVITVWPIWRLRKAMEGGELDD